MKKILFVFSLVCLTAGFVHTQGRPAWVDAPSAVYPPRLYVSAVGSGRDRQGAESGALGSLVSYFKQSVTNTITISDTESQTNGRSTSASEMSQSIEAVAALDTLIGAEIKTTWNDTGNRTWYALAVMEKAKCGSFYSEEFDKTVNAINTLIDISGELSFETITNCQRAQKILGKADVYALMLTMLDGPNRHGEVSRLNAVVADILSRAKALPVDVRVSGDVNGRFKAAFAGAFTAEGFKTGNRNSRFALEAAVTLTPVTLGRYFNTRYTVDAVLKDTQTGAELFTYNIANRESHPASQAEADNRAIIGAERKITEDFPKILQEYLNAD